MKYGFVLNIYFLNFHLWQKKVLKARIFVGPNLRLFYTNLYLLQLKLLKYPTSADMTFTTCIIFSYLFAVITSVSAKFYMEYCARCCRLNIWRKLSKNWCILWWWHTCGVWRWLDHSTMSGGATAYRNNFQKLINKLNG